MVRSYRTTSTTTNAVTVYNFISAQYVYYIKNVQCKRLIKWAHSLTEHEDEKDKAQSNIWTKWKLQLYGVAQKECNYFYPLFQRHSWLNTIDFLLYWIEYSFPSNFQKFAVPIFVFIVGASIHLLDGRGV